MTNRSKSTKQNKSAKKPPKGARHSLRINRRVHDTVCESAERKRAAPVRKRAWRVKINPLTRSLTVAARQSQPTSNWIFKVRRAPAAEATSTGGCSAAESSRKIFPDFSISYRNERDKTLV